MNSESVELPGLYDLVVEERVDSARRLAERLAAQGAEEGTVVWAKSQSEGRGRTGRYWMSGARNLHCAVVLRPEEDFQSCCQLSLLATISAALAVSRQAEPLEELTYRWPNDILLNRGKLGGICLSGELDAAGSVPWMVISLNVNVYEHPSVKGFAAASMRGEGFASYRRDALLESFSRELLSWLNRWSDEGFAPVRRAWLTRGACNNENLNIVVGDREYQGSFHGLSTAGDLRLEGGDGKISTIRLSEFFAAEFVRQGEEPKPAISHSDG